MTTTSKHPAPNPSQSVAIQITEQDKARLEDVIGAIQRGGNRREDLSSLIKELNRATVVKGNAISRNVVTMNSRVAIIDQDTSERMTFTLVFPQDADADADKISVLSPIGSAVLGYKTGDEVRWAVPAGIRRFTIAKVEFQPEAAARPNL